MNGIIFALLIFGIILLRTPNQNIKRLNKETNEKHDLLSIEKSRNKLAINVVFALIIGFGMFFYMPLVLVLSINWLFDLELTYWWVFTVYVLYIFTLKRIE